MSSLYVNQVGVSIAELVRLRFAEVNNGEHEVVVDICMHVETLKNLNKIIEQSLQQYEEAMAKQAQVNKGMN